MDVKELFTLFRNHTHTGAYPDAKRLPPWAVNLTSALAGVGLISRNNNRFILGVDNDGAFTVQVASFSNLLTSPDSTIYAVGVDSDGAPTTSLAATVLKSVVFQREIPLCDSTGEPWVLFVDDQGYLCTAPGTPCNLPPGTSIDFSGASVPHGFLLEDGAEYPKSEYVNLYSAIGDLYNTGGETAGYFRVPKRNDGRYTRGVGGNAGSTVGALQNDMFQGHKHINGAHTFSYPTYNAAQDEPTTSRSSPIASAPWITTYPPYVGKTSAANIDDGTNGTPRYGSETRPLSIVKLPCIKY